MSSPPVEPDHLDAFAAADGRSAFTTHLVALRTRLLRCIACVAVVLIALLPFSDRIYRWLADPLFAQLPAGSGMIATQVASSFLAPFKLTVFVAIFICVPVIVWQFSRLVAPRAGRLAVPLLAWSTALFYAGVAFAYWIVLPLLFRFFVAVAPEGIRVMTDINQYLDFVINMFLAFGAAFEVPVITYLAIRTGMTTIANLRAMRPYVIVGAFVVGAALTPPDVISQVLLAVPIWLFFEAGLYVGSYHERDD